MRPGKRRALPDTPGGRLQDLFEMAKNCLRAKVSHLFWVITSVRLPEETLPRHQKEQSQAQVAVPLGNLFKIRHRRPASA
jgi:IS5 family transposase